MQLAAQIAGPDGILLTTDADAVVASDWIERNLLSLASGADLVCGQVSLDPVDATNIPLHLHVDDALECELTELLDSIAATLDPDPADPWPRHTELAGASLAVTVAAFNQVGGIPALTTGEDRAFVQALARMDAHISDTIRRSRSRPLLSDSRPAPPVGRPTRDHADAAAE